MMKISIQIYDETFTADISDGATAAETIHTFCKLLVASGFSEQVIADAFKPGDDAEDVNPLKWCVR